MKAVEVEHLIKKYGETTAVNDISFTVESGSLFAYLGENGAGKSTTIHILCTILRQTSGTARICGYSLGQEDDVIRRSIGIVFQTSVLDSRLTVKQNLLTRGAYYGLSKPQILSRIQEFEPYFDTKDLMDRRYGTLSGGQKRRIDIMRALLHSPKILFLDEPTTGLDPKSRKQVWDYIHFLRQEQGMTIFLTTHYMEETSCADQVVIMDKGSIICSGTPAALKSSYTSSKLIWYTEETDSHSQLLEPLGPHVYSAGHYTVPYDSHTLAFLYRHRDQITDYEILKGNMDDVFLKLTGRKMET